VTGYYKVLVRGRRGEPYNIGVEAPEISMRDLAQRLVDTARDLFGYRGRMVVPERVDEAYLVDNPTRRCPDIRKARRELDYAPSVGIEEGVRRSLIWYRDHAIAEDA
jgi:nucleoside-diphosphate-sugar epimerase